MGFGLSQEIFTETYQCPLIVDKETQAEPKLWLRGHISIGAARISWEQICCRWRRLNRILAEGQSPLPLPNLNERYSKLSGKIIIRLFSKPFPAVFLYVGTGT